MNDTRSFDAEKAGNGLPNGKNGGLNGNVGPLPPDGMYHVSDMHGNGGTNGPNIDMIHGSLTDEVNSKFIMPASCTSV